MSKVIKKRRFEKSFFSLCLTSFSPFCSAMVVNDPGDLDLSPIVTPYTSSLRSDGKCTLGEAIALANWTNQKSPNSLTKPTKDCGTANVGNNTITFKDNYTINLVKKFIGTSATFEIISDIKIDGPAVIDAKASGRIFRLAPDATPEHSSDNAELYLNKITLQNGQLSAGGGAAIEVASANALLVISESVFKSNKTNLSYDKGGDGGAINNIASLSKDNTQAYISGVLVYNSMFEHNEGSYGGAYYGPPMFVNWSDFKNNKASHGGGAVYVTGNSDRAQHIHTSYFKDNSVHHPYSGITDPEATGGAVHSGSKIYMTYNIFSANKVTSDIIQKTDPSTNSLRDYDGTRTYGGALYLGSNASGSLIFRSIFYGNTAGTWGGSGGAIHVGANGSAILSGLSINSNSSINGWGIAVSGIGGFEDKILIANSSIISDKSSSPGSSMPPPSEFSAYHGDIVSLKSLPVEIMNSTIYPNSISGRTLIAYNSGNAQITLFNSALGTYQQNYDYICEGFVYDGGNNLRSPDLSEFKMTQSHCPESIPVAKVESGLFANTTPMATANIGYKQTTPLTDQIAFPATTDVADQMKGLGDPMLCNSYPVSGRTQNEKKRINCDIGPTNL